MELIEYDAFTTTLGHGNPAGVALVDDGSLDDDVMQRMARAAGFNESVFVFRDGDRFRLRYFTPGHEVDLCGHATIAAVGFLRDRGLMRDGSTSILTKVGEIAVGIETSRPGPPRVWMEQGELATREFRGSRAELCASLGITTKDLDPNFPVCYGSTGIWTLLVPLQRAVTLKALKPENDRFPAVLQELPRASVHPYSVERLAAHGVVDARHFSSPFSQTIEDPVTGTASGVIGEFLRTRSPEIHHLRFTVQQGAEVGRPGTVEVTAQKGRRVIIAGHWVQGGEIR